MNVEGRVRLAALMWLLAAAPALAQGFAGLGGGGAGFAAPDPATVLAFPADHGPHPDFRVEWWYVTANLEAKDGTRYGAQWTLFRSALAPGEAEGWQSPQVWMGHAAVTTPDRHFSTERFARGGTGQAGVTAAPFAAWIDEWHLQGASVDRLAMAAGGADFAFDLALVAEGPLVLHGAGGYSVKSPQGQASHYYSQPFYKVSGTLTLPEGAVAVEGQAWLDREWSSQPLEETQQGWDWASLHFDDGAKLMAAQVRQAGGGSFVFATWIGADGTATSYGDGALRMTPLAQSDVAGHKVPTRWRVELPARALDVTLSALNPRAWMPMVFPYWEGPVSIEGSETGVGYLEMTGYE